MSQPDARRPIKSRASGWAQSAARLLLRLNFSPNGVSVASVIFAGLAASCIYCSPYLSNTPWLWLAAAICIQLRLICNLLDGMLAVEGGLGTANGDLYNETPDRIADILILAAAGYCCQHPLAVTLGWGAASSAVLTAYIRMHGASLTGSHDFCGPMAKPHRMAAMTVVCLLMAITHALVKTDKATACGEDILFGALALIAATTFFTFLRRLFRLSQKLTAAP